MPGEVDNKQIQYEIDQNHTRGWGGGKQRPFLLLYLLKLHPASFKRNIQARSQVCLRGGSEEGEVDLGSKFHH